MKAQINLCLSLLIGELFFTIIQIIRWRDKPHLDEPAAQCCSDCTDSSNRFWERLQFLCLMPDFKCDSSVSSASVEP